MSDHRCIDVPVRWGDLDAFNHVNNTIFLRFVEEARIHYFSALDDHWKTEQSMPVVVNINCNFRQSIAHPATVRITTRAEPASERRLLMYHELLDADNPEILYADAQVTALWVDQNSQRATTLPRAVRELLQADAQIDAGNANP